MKTLMTLACMFATATVCTAQDTGIVIPPTIMLNPQDVPIFYQDSPLRDVGSFVVATSFPEDMSQDLETHLGKAISKSLRELGSVAYLDNKHGINVQGMGTGTVVLIQIAPVKTWQGQTIPLYRLSLSVETAVTLDKTGMKSFPMVWSVNAFVEQSNERHSKNDLVKAMNKLLHDFVNNYRYANPKQLAKPLFYSYDKLVS